MEACECNRQDASADQQAPALVVGGRLADRCVEPASIDASAQPAFLREKENFRSSSIRSCVILRALPARAAAIGASLATLYRTALVRESGQRRQLDMTTFRPEVGKESLGHD